jgi:hypothetical protein
MVARDCGEKGIGNYCLTGTKFQFCRIDSESMRMDSFVGGTAT